MRQIATLVIVLALCAALSACGSSSSAPSSPKRVLASIVAAALAQKSVHYGSYVEVDMGGSSTSTADVTADSGIAQEKFSIGTLEIRLVNHTVYVHGDVEGLRNALLLTLPKAKRYAGRWISIPRADTLYATTADGLTLASSVHDFAPHSGLKQGRNESSGTRFLAFQWMTSDGGFENLSARASGEPLPVFFSRAIHDSGDSYVVHGNFSHWNELVHVIAPANSVPIATVRG